MLVVRDVHAAPCSTSLSHRSTVAAISSLVGSIKREAVKVERVSEKLPSGALIKKDAAGRHKVSPGLASQMKWAMVQASWSSRKEQSMILKKGEALASLKPIYELKAPRNGACHKALRSAGLLKARVVSGHHAPVCGRC